MTNVQEGIYDIIFAGGGSAACITAGRLASADPTLKILVVESGPHVLEKEDHIQPGRYFANLAQGKEVFTFHKGKPSPSLLGRSPLVPTGHAVGGGSTVNFMVYTRAAASDYDDWENKYGNRGWSSKHLIPLLKKAETFQADYTNETHGHSGPIKISYAPTLKNVSENFLETAAAYDKERSITQDTNNFVDIDKYGPWARYIDAETGRRSDTAHHYIYNQHQNKNLTVLANCTVVRVIFEDRRAVGIEYIDEAGGPNVEGGDNLRTARASRLVVLAAGALGSPGVLERSGIGAKQVLDKNSVPVLVDLPGVGGNYMDHNLVFQSYVATDDADTLDSVFHGNEDEIAAHAEKWLKDGSGLMSHNGADAGVKMRPNAKELAAMSPEFDHTWKTYFANAIDKPVMVFLPVIAYVGANPTVPRGKYFSIGYFSGYPVSLGSVHITSGENPHSPLDFHPGFLDDPADLVILRWAYKKSRELARRMKFYRGEIVVGHPKFKEGSNAATSQTAQPQSLSTPDIDYSKEDDDMIDEYHRQSVETTWHSLGTCAMKPRDQGGVVDERLNVYGVQGLKVADLSIAPGNVAANTYNTAIAIGEKAAFIIAEDLGIVGVAAE